MVGTVGGREFALNVSDFNDFEESTTVTYSIGPGAALFGGKAPATGPAALADAMICQANVTHAYLRKHAGANSSADDAWRLNSAFVYLNQLRPDTRVPVNRQGHFGP